jgi:ABC-type uncharacterized transport system fused permease/ATPase subunit
VLTSFHNDNLSRLLQQLLLLYCRENAESIAFYGGERAERRLISRHLDSALENTRRLITTERNLGFFTAGYELLVEVSAHLSSGMTCAV